MPQCSGCGTSYNSSFKELPLVGYDPVLNLEYRNCRCKTPAYTISRPILPKTVRWCGLELVFDDSEWGWVYRDEHLRLVLRGRSHHDGGGYLAELTNSRRSITLSGFGTSARAALNQALRSHEAEAASLRSLVVAHDQLGHALLQASVSVLLGESP